jgi:membrane fusion protein (multidrug efflux system)
VEAQTLTLPAIAALLATAAATTVAAGTIAAAAPGPRIGTVFPFAEIPLVTQAGGKVAAVNAAEGEYVRRGQVLLAIDTSREQAEIKLIESQIGHKAALRLEELALATAKEDLARDEALSRDKSVPQKQLKDSLNRVKLATERVVIERGKLDEQRQQLAIRRQRLDEYQVLAPAAGVMASVLLHSNQVVNSGAKVGELLQIDQVYVETFVPLAEAVRLKPGGRATVHPDGQPAATGRVKILGQKVDPVSGSVKVKILVPNEGHRLKPGMLVRVSL